MGNRHLVAMINSLPKPGFPFGAHTSVARPAFFAVRYGPVTWDTSHSWAGLLSSALVPSTGSTDMTSPLGMTDLGAHPGLSHIQEINFHWLRDTKLLGLYYSSLTSRNNKLVLDSPERTQSYRTCK